MYEAAEHVAAAVVAASRGAQVGIFVLGVALRFDGGRVSARPDDCARRDATRRRRRVRRRRGAAERHRPAEGEGVIDRRGGGGFGGQAGQRGDREFAPEFRKRPHAAVPARVGDPTAAPGALAALAGLKQLGMGVMGLGLLGTALHYLKYGPEVADEEASDPSAAASPEPGSGPDAENT